MNDLLEKANLYPIGTKIKSVYNDVSHIVSKPIFIRYENIYTFDEKGDIRCIYDKALNQWAEIIKEEPMTQQEFNALRVGDFINNYEILHKYKDFLIVRCEDGHDLFDLNKINKLGLKVKPKKFMGLEVKKYDYVPCEVNDSALVYLCYVKEDGILFSNCKNGNIDNLKPKSIRIL